MLFRAIMVPASAIAAVAVLEAGARLFIHVTDVRSHFWDPVLGARPEPNQRGKFVRPGGVRAAYSFNAQGWRHPEDYAIERPSGATRVCVVGDSYVEALHVETEESLTRVGQRAMGRPGRPAQWYAFGCSGFGLAHYYLTIRHYVADYRPDAVVVVLVPNDVYDSSPYLVSSGTSLNTLDVDDEGAVHLIQASRFQPGIRRMAYHSAVLRFLFAQYGIHRPAGGMRDRRYSVFLRDEGRGELLRGSGLSLQERARLSWNHARGVLKLLKAECNHMGADLLLAYVGNGPYLRALQAGQSYEVIPPEKDLYCMNERVWEMGTDYLEPLAAELGVEYLDLTEKLADMVRRTGAAHDFGHTGDDHYNAAAHEVAGMAIAERLGQMLAGRGPDQRQPRENP